MKQLKVVLIIILTGMACFLGCIMAYGIRGGGPMQFFRTNERYELNEQRRIESDGIVSIEVEGERGGDDIVLAESPSERLIVEYSRENAETEPIKIAESGGKLTVISERRQRGYREWFSFYNRKIKICIPAGYDGELSVNTTSGNIRAEQELYSKGTISLTADSGNIEVAGAEAKNIEITASSGNIRAGKLKAQQANIMTGSGNIQIKSGNFGGNVEAGSGNISLGKLKLQGNAAVSAGSGNIRIKTAPGEAYLAEAHTRSGWVETDDWREMDGGEWKWKVGNEPSFMLRMNTTSGNIRVRAEDE